MTGLACLAGFTLPLASVLGYYLGEHFRRTEAAR